MSSKPAIYKSGDMRCFSGVTNVAIKRNGAGISPISVFLKGNRPVSRVLYGLPRGNHSSGISVTADLVRPTRKHRGPRQCFPIWSCSGWGLPCRRMLPPARCALTAPFHPYPAETGRYIFCCTFRRLAPPRRYLAPCPVEPGLSSPARPKPDGAIAWPTPGRIVA